MIPSAKSLRNVYSAEEFSSEVLEGKRTPIWVRRQCKKKNIRTVGRRPWIIPQSEAVRFISPPAR